MIKVKKDNVIYSIPEDEKKDYLKRGFLPLDDKGNIIEEKIQKNIDSKDIKKLNKTIEDLTKQVEDLTTEKLNLETEKADLTKQVEDLNKLIEESKKNKKDE